MLVPSVASATAQFYPIGNTPAISLTRAVPQGRDANILLAGCGDARNILFTAYMQEKSCMLALVCYCGMGLIEFQVPENSTSPAATLSPAF